MSTSRVVVSCALLAIAAVACEASPFREVDLDTLPDPATDAGRVAPNAPTFRVSVASMESPRWTYSDYAHIFEEVGRRLGMSVTFVQRRGYADVNALLASGGIDAALLCTGGYLALERTDPGAAEPLVVPIVHGVDTYRSLLIVPVTSDAHSLADLRGKRFAFTDALSLSGHMWTVHELKLMGTTPGAFFASTIFTSGHDRSITAVARGIVAGAAVHELIYEHMVARDPPLAGRTRIIERSPPFGMTPVVVSTRMPPAIRAQLRQVLTTLADDSVGEGLLRAVQIDRFAVPAPGLFDPAARALEK